MHTHFGSATMLAQTFIGVLLAGTFWRLAWGHTLRFATRRSMQPLKGLSRAALLQF